MAPDSRILRYGSRISPPPQRVGGHVSATITTGCRGERAARLF